MALVGETGAGKSTVVKLIARFYDVTSGEVLIDGIPLRTSTSVAYRRQLGYVPQEPFLFAGTIRDNIAYGRFDASEAEVESAARAVGAHEMIVEAGGYLRYVTERGRSLSIGQRQLLCLARALLVNPAILLLDEATSNLDLSSEAKVSHAMGIVASGRSTVLIAHRLQSARRTDRILVVEHGKIVEQGSHDAAARGKAAATGRCGRPRSRSRSAIPPAPRSLPKVDDSESGSTRGNNVAALEDFDVGTGGVRAPSGTRAAFGARGPDAV